MGQRRIGQASLAQAPLPAGADSNRRLACLIDWAPMERLRAGLRAPKGLNRPEFAEGLDT